MIRNPSRLGIFQSGFHSKYFLQSERRQKDQLDEVWSSCGDQIIGVCNGNIRMTDELRALEEAIEIAFRAFYLAKCNKTLVEEKPV